MQFRTEIGLRPDPSSQISHGDSIVMLGSCFTDNVGQLLARDGFDVTHNPMGPLYNPASIANAIDRACSGRRYVDSHLDLDDQQRYHCLDFASRYVSDQPAALLQMLNDDIDTLSQKLKTAQVAIFTLGTAYIYLRNAPQAERIVGNCHKFPALYFERRMLTVDECVQYLQSILRQLPDNIRRVIFTVSPIRHIGDGLHGNQLSKSTLLLAINHLADSRVAYFPAYEIMLDDLRDYRFYAADMKHPSDVAIDYIYDNFATVYFNADTKRRAEQCRKQWLHSQHRPLHN